jgi:hypothetical protein
MEDNNKPQAKAAVLEITPQLRRKAIMNSGLLALQFGMVALVSLKAGQTFFGIIGLLATVGTINDTLTFYYANKEK